MGATDKNRHQQLALLQAGGGGDASVESLVSKYAVLEKNA